MISVIVPVLDEEKLLRAHYDYWVSLRDMAELVFVDGGSRDATWSIIKDIGHAVRSLRGRGRQMNEGASRAAGDILLFLHADSSVRTGDIPKIESDCHRMGLVGGCLRQVIDAPGFLYRWIALAGNARARFTNIFYGDQGIFVRKDVFEAMKGFPEVSLCEDVMMSRLLRRKGRVVPLAYPVRASARRWQKQGVWKTFLLNVRIYATLAAGGDPSRFASFYKDVR